MAESQGNGLKTAANGLFHKNFEFGPLFWYDNFQNKIGTWETTVVWAFKNLSENFILKQCNLWVKYEALILREIAVLLLDGC